MPIDFTLTPEQTSLRREARAFAHDVLSQVARATLQLPTLEARFAATRPFYEQAVEAGFLRRLVPVPLGGGTGAPLAAFAFSEPGGSANFAAPAPAEGVRTTARREGDAWVITDAKRWVSSGTGWDGAGPDVMTVVCRTDPNAAPDRAVSVIAVQGPATGVVLDHAIHSHTGTLARHKGKVATGTAAAATRLPSAWSASAWRRRRYGSKPGRR